MARLTRLKRFLHWSAASWSVGLKFYPDHVNYWFRHWLGPTRFPRFHRFPRRLALWLNDCWGLGWDMRSRWESEYFIRIGYLEIYVDFTQKTEEVEEDATFEQGA